MSEPQTDIVPTLVDWRDFAPPTELHSCDCRYCEEGGEMERPQWPMLVPADADGVEYVTDRFMLLRANLAPIPPDYEGPISPQRADATTLLPGDLLTDDEPDPEQPFRWSIHRMLDKTGWSLRRIAGQDLRVGVVDSSGALVGVAIAARRPCDDFYSDNFTIAYGAHATWSEEADRG